MINILLLTYLYIYGIPLNQKKNVINNHHDDYRSLYKFRNLKICM